MAENPKELKSFQVKAINYPKGFTVGLVDWKKRDLFLKLIDNPDPIYSVFPKEKSKGCIHIKGEYADHTIERHLKNNDDLSLGVILGIAKPQPDDWGTKKEHKNKAGYVRAWGASDSHIDHLNVFVVEGDPKNMDPDEQVSCIHKAGLPPASFTVLSGNKSVHQYWKVNKCPADKWRNIQERLIKLIKQKAPELQVDESIKNTSRVMRCAGGRHSRTKQFCEVRSIADHVYSWETFNNILPELENKNKSFITDTAKKDNNSDKGWLDRLEDPAEKRKLIVDMLKVIPIHKGEGKGRRLKICIPVLAGLVNSFGNEAINLTNEAGWHGDLWVPENEIQYLNEPRADLGTVVHWAREFGWIHPNEYKKPEVAAATEIKIEDIFPIELARDIKKITTYLPYKDSLMILCFMTAVAPLIRLGTKINCNPFSDFVLPLNLYGCVIGQSGSKKTPLMRLLIEDPLKGVKSDIARENYKAGQQYVRDLAAYQSSGGDKPERPAYPIVMIKDATAESLEKQLIQQERAKLGLLRLNDELAGYIKSFGAYKQGKGKDEEQHLELYDGGGPSTLRMEENRYAQQSSYSIFGGAQPEVMKKLQQGQDHNGKWARFIFDYLEAKPTKLATSGTAAEKEKFNMAKERLSDFIREVRAFRTNSLELSPEALEKFADFEFARQGVVSKKGIKPAHAAIFNKSAGKVGRVAGILHIIEQVQAKIKNKILQGDSYVDEPPLSEVQVETINKAIDLVNYWDSLSNNIAAKSSESSVDEILKRLLHIAAKSKTPVPFTELKKGLSWDHRMKYTTAEIYTYIEKLEELDLGVISKGPREGKMFKAEKPWPTA